jgi:hypothetical protein
LFSQEVEEKSKPKITSLMKGIPRDIIRKHYKPLKEAAENQTFWQFTFSIQGYHC